ncbi:hypothetical protein [Streptomyces adelaidensis]|uniref:hypothetical protein n=1 Tax=Streptomyces adelaidensis TaxID=2796465 RepID=UPI001908BB46|nr:hypothetical protein [Streptomyces adelaidensis]
MTRILAVSLATAALFLTATSCTTEESPSTTAADGCEEALGDSGVKWVESHADIADGDDLDRGSVDLKEARAQHYKQLEDGGSDEYQQHWSSEICKMITYGAGKSKELRLEFGPSSLSFYFEEKGKQEGVITPVNSGVKLHQVDGYKGVIHYSVYVKCKIPGTSPRQEMENPLAGVMTDTLTSGTSDRDHMKYLLRSARAMADALDCENKPTIPAEPPAAVQ